MKSIKEKTMGNLLKLLGWALAALLAAGCEAPLAMLNHEAPAGQSAGQAIIRIGDSAPARSLVPDTAPVFAKYELVFTAEGKEDVYRSLETSRDRTAINGNGYAVDLEEAAWTVTVSAFVQGTDSIFLEAARGTSSFTVSAANRNPSVAITLSPLPMDGENMGILTWNLNLSGVSGNVRVDGIITRVADGIPDGGTFLPAGISGSKELLSGYYLLQFNLYKEGKSAGVYRAVHIYPGLTTKAEGADFTFTEEDFAAQKYLAGTAAISGVPYGRTVEWVKVQPYQDPAFVIPLAEAVTVAADGSWFLSIPGSAADVYFKLRMKLNSPDEEYNFNAGKETAVPDEGKKDIALSAVWSANRYTVSYTVGTGGSGTPPPNVEVVLGDTVYLPMQSGGGYAMTPPSGRNFIGWTINGQNYSPNAEYVVTGDTVCTARWGTNGPLSPKPQPELIGGKPIILWSSTDFTGNTYLVYAGTIQNVYISTLDTLPAYEGIPYIYTYAYNESSTSSVAVKTAVSETISASVTVGLKASIGVSAFGVKTGFEASMSATTSATTGYSREDTVTKASTWATTVTYSHPFTPDDPEGSYRLALYADVSDVYFLL